LSKSRVSTPQPLDLSKLSSTPQPESSGQKRIGSAGLRSLFRSRSSLDKAESTTPSPRTPGESPNLERSDLVSMDPTPRACANKKQEYYLRIVTVSPSADYTPESPYPRHPNTSRDWRSRNLKCTTCEKVCCGICGRACCAFRAALMALETHQHNQENLQHAMEKVQEISRIFPYGKETPTFIQCTNSVGGGSGCGKMVCPDCCGVCPNEACGDTQCRRCKKDPWVECGWHADGTLDMDLLCKGKGKALEEVTV